VTNHDGQAHELEPKRRRGRTSVAIAASRGQTLSSLRCLRMARLAPRMESLSCLCPSRVGLPGGAVSRPERRDSQLGVDSSDHQVGRKPTSCQATAWIDLHLWTRARSSAAIPAWRRSHDRCVRPTAVAAMSIQCPPSQANGSHWPSSMREVTLGAAL